MISSTYSLQSSGSTANSRSTSGSTAPTARRTTATATMRSVESFKRRRRARTAAFTTIFVTAAMLAVGAIVLGALVSDHPALERHVYTFEPVTLTAAASPR